MAEPPLLYPGQWIAATFGLAVFNLDGNLAAQLKEAYGKNENCQEAIKDVQLGIESDFSLSKEGVLLREDLIYVPNNRDTWLRLMAKHHDKLTASHLGHDRILELLGWNYHLPDVRKYVETYVAMSNVCTRVKAPHHKLFGLLQLLPIPDRAWESVLTDFIVKLPPSRDPDWPKGREFNSIWVVVDRLMKMVHLVLCNELITSEQLAHLYMSYIFMRHGMPKTIISD